MTSTAVTHHVEKVTVYLGAGSTTVLYRIVDNLGRLVAWEEDRAVAERRARLLSQPRVDE